MSQRVLYLVPNFLGGSPGGIARYCQLVARALVEAGYELSVLALADPEQGYEEAQEHFPTITYSTAEGSKSTYILKGLKEALRIDPHIIMIGHVNLAPLGWLAARVGRSTTVAFIYGIDAWTPLRRLWRTALIASDHIIAISHHTAREAAKVNKLNADDIDILHNCLHPSFEQPEEKPRNTSVNLLTVARLSASERYKGHEYVMEALCDLLPKFPELNYHIIGDGDDKKRLERLASDLNIEDAVHFHGFVSEQTLRDFYRHATVYVMPSRSEGFGFVFLEAMAYRTPVIGGNRDATVEVIDNTVTGFTIDPTSSTEIAEKISLLLTDSELYQQMSQAGVIRATDQFGFPVFKQRLLTILNDESDIPS